MKNNIVSLIHQTEQTMTTNNNFQHVAFNNLPKSQSKKRLTKFDYWTALENNGITMRFNTSILILKKKCVELNINVK